MNEPPILPQDSQFPVPSPLASEELENPYAPTASAIPANEHLRPIELPPTYWIMLGVAIVSAIGVCFVAPGLGVPAFLAVASAAVRVPLILRRSSDLPAFDRPDPLVLLLTSWGLSLVMGAASLVAFCVVCLPTGAMAFSLDGDGVAVPIAFGLSILIALAFYVFLFKQSLKMRV